jgi:hypothetical protein
VAAGSVAWLFAAALVLGNQAVGVGLQGLGGLVVNLGLGLVGAGAALLAGTGQGPVVRQSTRLGLAILAVGMLAVLLSTIAVRPTSASDPAVLLILVLQLVVGMPAAVLGWLIIGLTLASTTGRERLVGRTFVLGVALLPIVLILANADVRGLRLNILAGPIGGLAVLLLIAAMGGLGFLALSDRWVWQDAAGNPPSGPPAAPRTGPGSGP